MEQLHVFPQLPQRRRPVAADFAADRVQLLVLEVEHLVEARHDVVVQAAEPVVGRSKNCEKLF
jgi:hypothetical protein